jgi:hypothetical protein
MPHCKACWAQFLVFSGLHDFSNFTDCHFREQGTLYVAFEVHTVAVMKSSVFWDVMPCSVLKVIWHFRGAYCHHLQSKRSKKPIWSRKQSYEMSVVLRKWIDWFWSNFNRLQRQCDLSGMYEKICVISLHQLSFFMFILMIVKACTFVFKNIRIY